MASMEECKPSMSLDKGVCVACKDKRFWRMLALEFERIGVDLSEYSEGIALSVLLVDLDDYPEPTPKMKAANTLVGWTRRQPSSAIDESFSVVLHRPFLTEELLSIVCELTETSVPPDSRIEFHHRRVAQAGCVDIFPTEREGIVSAGAVNIKLSPKEWLIFKRLYDAEGQTVKRDELVRLIGADYGANTLEVHICHIRDKIEKPLGIKAFYTVRGVGYRMSRT